VRKRGASNRQEGSCLPKSLELADKIVVAAQGSRVALSDRMLLRGQDDADGGSIRDPARHKLRDRAILGPPNYIIWALET